MTECPTHGPIKPEPEWLAIVAVVFLALFTCGLTLLFLPAMLAKPRLDPRCPKCGLELLEGLQPGVKVGDPVVHYAYPSGLTTSCGLIAVDVPTVGGSASNPYRQVTCSICRKKTGLDS